MVHVPAQPDRDRAAADEQRIGALLRAVEAPAPAAMHERIAELASPRRRARAARLPVARAGWPSAMGARGYFRRRRVPSFALAVAFAAAVTLAVVLSVGTTTAAPTALRVSQVALASWTGPAPRSLIAAGTTIPFPRWSARGWPSRGVRSDRVGGRIVTTEFYRSYEHGTLGYAIVSGSPLRRGAGGRAVTRSGSRYWVMSATGAQIVAWVQDGHTCVLASRSASAGTLLALAVAQYPRVAESGRASPV
jgi:hypothetical protein